MWELADGLEGGTRPSDSATGTGTISNPMVARVTLEWALTLDHLARYLDSGKPDPSTPAGADEKK